VIGRDLHLTREREHVGRQLCADQILRIDALRLAVRRRFVDDRR